MGIETTLPPLNFGYRVLIDVFPVSYPQNQNYHGLSVYGVYNPVRSITVAIQTLEDSLERLAQADGIFGKVIFYLGDNLHLCLPVDPLEIVYRRLIPLDAIGQESSPHPPLNNIWRSCR